MPVTCNSKERTLHANLIGEVDHHGAKEIMRELEQQIDRILPRELILNCSGVTFMDSSGIAVLLRTRQRMESCGGTLRVLDVPAQASKVLRAANLQKIIPFE